MNVPFVDLRAQYDSLKDEILPAIQKVIESTQFILGESVAGFENQFASMHGAAHCIGVGSGTDALHLALWAMGVGSEDEVITVPHTFIATAEAISLLGARPVFVDVDPDTYTMNPELLERAITPKTKAIIPVHLYGQVCAMEELMEIANRHKIPVLEDACQSHLATRNGRPAGSFGMAAAFSFYPGKNLGAYGEAGAVLTSDRALAEKMRMLRDHGQKERYHHQVSGHNYRMDGIQGAVLGVKLKHLPGWTAARQRHARLYDQLLRNVGDLKLPTLSPDTSHVYHLYVILSKQRDDLRKFLEREGIATGLHYPIPLHLQEAYAGLGYQKGSFPNSESIGTKCLSLPMFAELREDQIRFVCNKIREFF